MDYEKAYKSLIEELRQAKNDERKGYTFCSVIDDIVPELRDSEDEKIRQWLVEQMEKFQREAAKEECYFDFHKTEKALQWLKKKKWSKEDEGMRKLLIAIMEKEHPNGIFSTGISLVEYLGSNAVPVEQINGWLNNL